MRKCKLGVVGFLIMFLVFQISVVAAEKSDELIEDAISKLEAAQSALKNDSQEKAYNSLEDAKAQVTRAMFPLMITESDRKLLTDNFLIKAPKGFLRSETGFVESQGKYLISVDIMIENLTGSELSTHWNWYLIDPAGIQRSGNSFGGIKVLAGATTFEYYRAWIKESRFKSGTYTFILEPDGSDKRFKFKFRLIEKDMR